MKSLYRQLSFMFFYKFCHKCSVIHKKYMTFVISIHFKYTCTCMSFIVYLFQPSRSCLWCRGHQRFNLRPCSPDLDLRLRVHDLTTEVCNHCNKIFSYWSMSLTKMYNRAFLLDLLSLCNGAKRNILVVNIHVLGDEFMNSTQMEHTAQEQNVMIIIHVEAS